MLCIEAIEAGYDDTQVLFQPSLTVGSGEVVALLGRNGMGKTTLIQCIVGLLRCRRGAITFNAHLLSGMPPYRIARYGIALVPEGRQVFGNLTVRENLVATAANYGDLTEPWSLGRIFELFPQLKKRSTQMAGTLSGGEQQMLAIGRALMLSPKLLILDEAAEGLAPLIRQEIWDCLHRLKAMGHSILVIDKNLDELSSLTDRCYVMEKGQIAWSGKASELSQDATLRATYLGV
jgi:branched-chain amino acid transport system ATP-binding protein